MADKAAGIISYLISIGLMVYFLISFKRKNAGQPGVKIYGVPIKAIITLTYIGIAIFLILAVAVLLAPKG
jgi:heme/copper-type cytochrome/quinol oxidase subunit 2